MAPSSWTTPETSLTAGADVPNGPPVQPFCGVSAVNPAADRPNEAPSSEVKHWALENVPPSGSTSTTPLGAMCRRPLVALHRSTGTKTLVAGRNDAGRTNGSGLVPDVAMAPLKWTIPPMMATEGWPVLNGPAVQPLSSVRLVNVTACAAVAPKNCTGSSAPTAHKAPTAICRSFLIRVPPEHSPYVAIRCPHGRRGPGSNELPEEAYSLILGLSAAHRRHGAARFTGPCLTGHTVSPVEVAALAALPPDAQARRGPGHAARVLGRKSRSRRPLVRVLPCHY